MDVGARCERLDQAGVLGEMGDHAQLDLVVVGHQELAAVGGHERAAEAPALLAAHRDVVQVRRVRREPARARHRLVEGGVDATVGADLAEQALAVGGPQLLDLAVPKQLLDDRVLAEQLLERLRIVEKPVLVRFDGCSASLSKRIVRSCGVEFTLNGPPARSWIAVSSSRTSSVSDVFSSLR